MLKIKPQGLLICKDTIAYSTIFKTEKKKNIETELFATVLKYQCINANWDKNNSVVNDVLSLNNIKTTLIINRSYFDYIDEQYEGIDYDSIMESELLGFLDVVNEKITLGNPLSEDEQKDITLFKETFGSSYFTNDSLLLNVSSIDELELELKKTNSLMNLEILDSLSVIHSIVLTYAPNYLFSKKQDITSVAVTEIPKYFFLKRYIYNYEVYGHNSVTNIDGIIASDKWYVVDLEAHVLETQETVDDYFDGMPDAKPLKKISSVNRGTPKSINSSIGLIQRTFTKYGRIRILKPQSIYVEY